MKRSKGGFSLTELLTVVAIFAVLMAVAVPALAVISKNLKLRELDDTAREIFLAAQNTLTARKADGTVPEPEQGAEAGTDCYWLFDDAVDNHVGLLLPDGAVGPAVAENHIAVWYNATSAMVLEVYYGEKNGGFASPECDWDKDGIQNRSYSNDNQDVTSQRAEKRIGYYDGTDLLRGGVVQLLPPVLEIVNEDELAVKVTVPKVLEYLTNNVTLSVTVEELDNSGMSTGKSVEFPVCTYSAEDGTYKLVLDSLTEGSQQFKNVCPTIKSGTDIRVTAMLSAPPAADKTKYLSARAWKETNSLFAERTGDTVSVACARHLQNLNKNLSGLEVAEGRTLTVNQTNSIDWLATYPEFQPISSNGEIEAFNGNKLEIVNLRGSNGLFAVAGNAALTGIRIVNPQIKDETQNVGVLAGKAEGATIKDCRVYLSFLKEELPEDKGKTDFDKFTSPEYKLSGSANVGGLIGSATDCNITDSFAALSEVSGGTVGGFIGSASGCEIKNCYATTENLSGSSWSAMFVGNMSDGTVTGCYTAGNNMSTGGTISGFANGTGAFSDSYCAGSYNKADGTPTGISPEYGFAHDGTSTCAYLAVNTPTAATEYAVPMNYEELEAWGDSGWQTLSATQAHPYRAELDGKAYPFPGLKDSDGQAIPHYGSWPEQTVKGIKLFDAAAGGKELQVILVPLSGEATVWAESNPAGQLITAKPPKGQGSSLIYKPNVSIVKEDSGRTRITVEGKNGNNEKKSGVTYINLTADGYTLRAVVVVYSGSIELSSSDGLDEGRKTASDDYLGNEVLGYLALSSENSRKRTATLTTTFRNLSPDNPKSKFDSLYNDEPTANWSTDGVIFENWKKVKGGYPVITPEEDPITGAQVLTTEKLADGGLTVTGSASGTVQAIAEWAMNDRLPESRQLTAKMDVQMRGARALIKTAAATPCLDVAGGTVAKSRYPYQLDLTAEPGQDIDLTFTPHLFNGPAADTPNDRYTWGIYRVNEDGSRGSEVSGGNKTTTPGTDAESGAYAFKLTEHPAYARYLVMLTYDNPDTNEHSADYMYFSVYRKASRAVTDYSHIVLRNRDEGTAITAASAGTVEQITAVGYETADRVELEGYVSGAANPRVRWLVDAICDDEGETWVPVTGINGSQTIKDSGGVERAKVEWLAKESTTSVNGSGVPTGGAIRVAGLDSNEYHDVHTVKLKAEAMESGGTGESASSRTVTVKVMPKPEINPKSKTVISYWQVSFEFPVTRQDGKYPYVWKQKVNGMETTLTESGTYSQKIEGTENKTVEIECEYGPHRATATYTWMGIFQSMPAPINADYVVVKDENDPSKNVEYFLVEKGKTRELELTWGSQVYHPLGSHPSSTDNIEILPKEKGGADNPVWQGGVLSGYIGIRTYDVRGIQYTGEDCEALKWTIGLGSGTDYLNWDFTKYFAVVGMEINEPGSEIQRDAYQNLILSQNQSVWLSATTSFPTELMQGEPVLTWESDHPELVTVDSNGTITAVKTGASTYSATITATYTVDCVNGQTYTYKDYVTVKVEPPGTMAVTLEPCSGSDAEALNQAFGLTGADGLTAGSRMANVDENGVLTLIRDEAYGFDNVYLKATATLGGDAIDDLTEYISNVYSDEYYLKLDVPSSGFYRENPAYRNTLYIRVKAMAANTTPTDVELTAELGTDNDKKTIRIYDTPKIRFRQGNDDVTNGSLPIYQNDANTKLPLILTAGIEPNLYDAADTGKVSPLLQSNWELEAPLGYSAKEYLSLMVLEDGSAQVALKDLTRLPDFRAVLRASCGNSSAGYALVFLPENEPASESKTRRKRSTILEA